MLEHFMFSIFGHQEHRPRLRTFIDSCSLCLRFVLISFIVSFLLFLSIVHLILFFYSGLWSQQEFPSSETGLTYTIARAGLDTCRRRRHRTHQQAVAVQEQQLHQQQLQRQSQRK